MESTTETLHPKKKKKWAREAWRAEETGSELGRSGFEPVAPSLSTYVTMDKLFNLSEPWFFLV